MPQDNTPEGIESAPENIRFVGNGMKVNEWDKATVWSPGPIQVSEDVEIVKSYTASGKAPAVNSGAPNETNAEVAGWNKYELAR